MDAQSKRTRMNLKLSTKGEVTFDITSEHEDPEQAAVQLSETIDLVRKTCEEKGLKLAEAS